MKFAAHQHIVSLLPPDERRYDVAILAERMTLGKIYLFDSSPGKGEDTSNVRFYVSVWWKLLGHILQHNLGIAEILSIPDDGTFVCNDSLS